LRPVGDEDLAFLRRVYSSTRTEELAVTGWDDATKEAFLAQQFAAQHAHYLGNYEGATYDVVIVDGEPAGRLYVARWDDEIRVMDVALLPEHRGRGVGTRLLESLLEEGERSGKKVSIHVERANPAVALYERLGFEPVEEKGVYVLMERVSAGE
jgi:ribosomal protein S18 acetylase RimI-like enzyme